MKKILSLMAAFVILFAGVLGMGATEPVSAAVNTYRDYYRVGSLSSGLKIEPSLVLEPTSMDELDAATSATIKPATVILTVDEQMNVVFGTEKTPFLNVFSKYVRGKAIPALRLDGSTADAFLTFLHETYAIYDIMAVSAEIGVIEKIFADDTGRIVNTVYDLTNETLSSDRYAEWPHIAEANKAGCNILMYNGSDENLPVVAEYVEAMTKVCWAYTETKLQAVTAVAAGCYGVASKSLSDMVGAVSVFSKPGFARAQYIAAHRGITKYANEQSLTGIMASHNEGSTHVEIDIQITSDGVIVINHDDTITNATKNAAGLTIAETTSAMLFKYKLATYSKKYGDTFATLDDVVRMMQKTDVILIVELKLDNGSEKAVNQLKAIETLKALMDKYPGIAGHWYTITFYSHYAEKMREVLPEIPVGFLGAGRSKWETAADKTAWNGDYKPLSNIGGTIDLCRKYNMGLDEMTFDNEKDTMDSNSNNTAQDYLARGYTLNTWTFEDCRHFDIKANVATTNAAEKCASLIKTISDAPVKMTAEQLASGKFKFACTAYNGWMTEQECEFVIVEQSGTEAVVVPYITQDYDTRSGGSGTVGLYGMPTRVTVG